MINKLLILKLDKLNSASKTHFNSEFFNKFLPALLPIIKDKAFNKIDLPDPVSPVTVVKPERKSISTLSIKVKFFINIFVSTNRI